VGKEQLAALARIIDQQLATGWNNAVVGTWSIRYDAKKRALYFDKCEDGIYCEERPTVIDLAGNIIDPGGPIVPADV
jgi:hypothetical protein